MGKKGLRSIPDFSRQPKGPRDGVNTSTKAPPPPPPKNPGVKPQTKAGKSGNRGG